MAEITKQNRSECMQGCEATFIQLTAHKPVGGVEALRICRENCLKDTDGPTLISRQSQTGA